MSMQTVNEKQYEDLMSKQGVAVIEFGAVWCPPCKALLPILDDLGNEYGSSVHFAKVDVDQSPELASQHVIMGMPTVIVFKDGQPADKLVGLRPKEAYKHLIDRSLEA